ncbi:hypothetical protein BDV59DRAFT_202593 [Aspergillus ambiguus]|uniref:uncharacterized protein n=1 Tax=Aspergillus ambiguus TaxID=176160 RepID=UPI003CCDB531
MALHLGKKLVGGVLEKETTRIYSRGLLAFCNARQELESQIEKLQQQVEWHRAAVKASDEEYDCIVSNLTAL